MNKNVYVVVNSEGEVCNEYICRSKSSAVSDFMEAIQYRSEWNHVTTWRTFRKHGFRVVKCRLVESRR